LKLNIRKLILSFFPPDLHWPEGYLSAKKDTLVSNSRLCKAAIERGLEKFILTKVFTGSKWRPLYVDGLLEYQEDRTREMPSKTLADVVEALIGAGWKMGGYQSALLVAQLFLPELDLPSLEVGRSQLFDHAPNSIPLPEDLSHLEILAGYSFKKKSLLVQAMSHGSHPAAIASYERLEFLGDSILEILIVTELMRYEDNISHSLMHLYKTALVNTNYLGFIALEWNTTQKRMDLKENKTTGKLEEVQSQFSLPLWRFMRHGLSKVDNKQSEVERRHASLRLQILCAIESGNHYPWSLMAGINANKFYSDIVESLLGAVWVDSGSIDVCRQLLNRMGILKYLHRIVQDRVHVLNPREELAILADDKKVKYVVEVQRMDSGSDRWSCTIFVGETQAVEAVQGGSDDEVRTKAAEAAVSSMRCANGRSGSPISYGKPINRYRQARIRQVTLTNILH
jgi:dsRNA-specific ribonuclease